MTVAPAPQTIPIPDSGFKLEELDDDLLLFDAEDGRLLELNPTAALIWQLCDGKRSAAEITELLVEAYPDDEQAIRADVPAAMLVLHEFGALSW